MRNLSLSPWLALREPYGRDQLLLLLLTAVFIFTNAITLSLARTGQVSGVYLWAATLWFILMLLAQAFLRRFRPHHDPYLLPIFALLTGWGLITVQRLASNFLGRQMVWLVLSTAVLLAIAILPRSLRWLRRYRYTLLLGGILLLATTFLFGVNPSGFGAALWLPIPLIGRVFFQPSELLKLLLVIFLASYFDERESLLRLDGRHGRFGPLPYLAPLLLMWGFCMALLVWQRDLGAATLFFILFLALLYLASGDGRYVVGGLVLLLVSSVLAYYLFDVVALRVNAWWNPWPDASNRAYQIVQSLYALAAGGLAGHGVGQGFPNYIPVVHSDFVFAAVAEEWGLTGSLTVVACFLVLAYRGIKIAALAARPFRRYLAAGITVLFAAQAILIMGGVVKLLPLTGVTLPFLSYGGSSLLVSSVMVGLLLYLSATSGSGRTSFNPAMQQRLQQLLTAVIIGYLLVTASLLYWGVWRAQNILARSDNPRLVEAELRIRRGPIYDRQGVVVAETVGAAAAPSRRYPIANIGPAVGYYSFRHGAAGVEEGYNTVLRGDPSSFWQQVVNQNLHQPQTGRPIQLTLDARLQQIADALLGTRPGAMLLLDTQTGELLAMASHPIYDPNRLDEEFEALTAAADAPLLNRVAQGQYQPGLLLQPFLLAVALQQGNIRMDEVVPDANRPVTVNGQALQCAAPPPDPATWADVLTHRCPGPMQVLAGELGLSWLNKVSADFGLTAVPNLPLNTETPAAQPMRDPALAGIGQENLVLTPLQLALAWGALARDGQKLQPQLVTAVWDENGDRQPIPPPAGNGPVVDIAAARTIRQALTNDGRVEFNDLVLSGPDGSTNGWYVGVAPAANPRFLVVVVVEGSTAVPEATQIGRALLDTAVKQ